MSSCLLFSSVSWCARATAVEIAESAGVDWADASDEEEEEEEKEEEEEGGEEEERRREEG